MWVEEKGKLETISGKPLTMFNLANLQAQLSNLQSQLFGRRVHPTAHSTSGMRETLSGSGDPFAFPWLPSKEHRTLKMEGTDIRPRAEIFGLEPFEFVILFIVGGALGALGLSLVLSGVWDWIAELVLCFVTGDDRTNLLETATRGLLLDTYIPLTRSIAAVGYHPTPPRFTHLLNHQSSNYEASVQLIRTQEQESEYSNQKCC